MKRIRISGPAELDLDDIWYRIATEPGSTTIADRVVDSITEVFRIFSQTPEAGRKRDEIDAGLRSSPAGKYVVYYCARRSNVVIARVIHGMRDQAAAYSGE